MITIDDIKKFSKRIGNEFDVQKVILFGSYAKDAVVEDSDVDLLVITNKKSNFIDQSVQIRLKLQPKFPVDLLVRTPEKIKERLALGDQFIKDIFYEGKVLYEANNR